MKKENRNTGRLGEKLASEYLARKGYRIKERNFSTRKGEIDLVCYKGKTLVFVEVKAKIGHEFGEPEDMVDSKKLSRVRRMGEVYLLEHDLNVPCRIDVVAVVLTEDKSVERIDHYEAVY